MLPPREAERLTAADASNVVMDADDQVNVFPMAGILGVGGFVTTDGDIDLGGLRSAIAARIGDQPPQTVEKGLITKGSGSAGGCGGRGRALLLG